MRIYCQRALLICCFVFGAYAQSGEAETPDPATQAPTPSKEDGGDTAKPTPAAEENADTPPKEEAPRIGLQEAGISPMVLKTIQIGEIRGSAILTEPAIGKAPLINMTDPLYGLMSLGIESRPIVLFKSEADAPFRDRLVIDTDGDKSMTGETVIKFKKINGLAVVTLQLGKDKVKRQYAARLDTKTSVRLFPLKWMEGMTLIGDTPHKAALIDTNHDAMYDKGDIVVIDLDNNGKWDVDPTKVYFPEAYQIGTTIWTGSSLLTVTALADGTQLTCNIYDGETGQLAIPALPAAAKDAVVAVTLLGKSGPLQGRDVILTAPVADWPRSLPIGAYILRVGILRSKDNLSAAYFKGDLFRGRDLLVRKEAPAMLPFTRPEMAVVCRENNGYIFTSLTLTGADGTVWTPANLAPTIIGPVVEVAHKTDKERVVLFTGNMALDAQGGWSLGEQLAVMQKNHPEITLQQGDTLEVTIRIDLPFYKPFVKTETVKVSSPLSSQPAPTPTVDPAP